MYNLASPPYFLLIVSLLASLLSGIAYAKSLQRLVTELRANQSVAIINEMRGLTLKLPYIGIAGGAGLFLAACLGIFGFKPAIAYGFSLPLTIITAVIVWLQFSKILNRIEKSNMNKKN